MDAHARFCSVPLLATIPPDVLALQMQKGAFGMSRFGKRQMVHLQGDRCSALDIVLEGSLLVEKIDEEGNIFSVASFGTGSIVGGNLLFASQDRYPHAITSGEQTLILRIAREKIFSLCQEYPAFLKEFLRAVSDNTAMVNEKLSDVVHRSLRQKLSLYLKREAIRQGTSEITLTVNKTRLAQLLGVSRTSVSRELRNMKDAGLLQYVNKNILLSQIFLNLL